MQFHDPAAASDTGYLAFSEINGLVDSVLKGERTAGHAAASGHVFHGFSRGSANMYELAVRDGQDGARWGTHFIADEGAWSPSGPPPTAVAAAVASNDKTALLGTKFYVFYALQDHDPDQNGITGQTNAAMVVQQLGGEAKTVEDATGCHSVMETGMTSDRAFPALLWALDLAP